MNKRQIIAALVEKTGTKIDENDPAFLLVELNIIMLDNVANNIATKLEDIFSKKTNNYISSIDDSIKILIKKNVEIERSIIYLQKSIVSEKQNLAIEMQKTINYIENSIKIKYRFITAYIIISFLAGIIAGILIKAYI